MGGANGFLGASVDVVAKRGADVSFDFNGCDQSSLIDHQKVPELGGSEVPREREQGALSVNVGVNQPIASYQIDDQIGKPIQIFSASHSGSFALIGFA
jgi:hypothetical protein